MRSFKAASVLLLIVAVFFITPATATESSGSPQTQQVLRQHFKTIDSVPSGFLAPMLGMGKLELEPQGRLFDIENFAAPRALRTAAQGYALATQDFDVSIADLLNTGLFPYRMFDASQLELRIPAVEAFSYTPEAFDRDLSELGTPELMVRYRHRVLNAFTHEYYFCDAGPARQAQIASLQQKANSAFWINPLTGTAMEHAVGKGNYQLVPLRGFEGAPPGLSTIAADVLVPAVNSSDQDWGDMGYVQ